MLEAPLSPNEGERLSQLRRYDILDTAPEQAFDDLTWLASRWCETPIALVSLVDEDRQWFKSRQGLDAAETPRKVAFCSHAILVPNEVMVIRDARLDDRFADNPIVTGEPRVIFYAGAPLVTPEGQALGTLCVIDHQPRDPSPEAIDALEALARQVVNQLELRRSCARLEKARTKLARANQDLSDFTFIAAHDLQEPLRKLMAFSELLTNDLGDDLPDAAREDLGFITTSADRMNTLVSDLLRLSKVDSLGRERKRFELDDCLDRALENVQIRIDETGAVIDREPLPSIEGAEPLMTQVFQNLICNAIKFCSSDNPRVKVSAAVKDRDTIITVSDNGIGIPAEKAEEIFAPFRRLHGKQEYEGTGIGLAIVRKAIERHGERVWAESRPEGGSNFSFTVSNCKPAASLAPVCP